MSDKNIFWGEEVEEEESLLVGCWGEDSWLMMMAVGKDKREYV